MLTPHLGYVERDSYELTFGAGFESLLAFLGGKLVELLNDVAR